MVVGNILIVDDEVSLCIVMERLLSLDKHTVRVVNSGNEALSVIQHEETMFDLIITDLKMEDMDGISLLKNLKALNYGASVIMITAFGTTETAVEAMKLGASEYILKPFKMAEMRILVNKALKDRQLQNENLLLKEALAAGTGFDEIIGKSMIMRNLFDSVRKVASLPTTVLITGESGTGKDLIARAIHFSGKRRDRPFVPVNCSALPETLLESELFGYMKGSFTGASGNKRGKFEIANGGTFFLDEVAEISPAIQVKLLRVLNDKKFQRIGGLIDIEVDVRIIAATNKNLEEEVRLGSFREDLFYRLNVIPIRMPNLRERREDIPFLIAHFTRKYCQNCGIPMRSFSNQAIEVLTRYHWPGNVRELENLVERSIALQQNEIIDIKDLPPHILADQPTIQITDSSNQLQKPVDLDAIMLDTERKYLLWSLEKANGVKKNAAEILGLTFRSFRYRLLKHGLNGDDDNGAE